MEYYLFTLTVWSTRVENCCSSSRLTCIPLSRSQFVSCSSMRLVSNCSISQSSTHTQLVVCFVLLRCPPTILHELGNFVDGMMSLARLCASPPRQTSTRRFRAGGWIRHLHLRLRDPNLYFRESFRSADQRPVVVVVVLLFV